MAGRFRPRIDTKAEWEDFNPVLADGEFVVEKDGSVRKFKIGDGATAYLDLPYSSVVGVGPVGPAGEFTGITDLQGTSITSLTISVGVKTFVADSAKSWKVGHFIQVTSVVSPENYMVGQVTAYNSVSGSITINVGLGGNQGVGTFASWNIAYAPGAGVLKVHGDDHKSGGSDPLPLADSIQSGLLPANHFTLLENIQVSGIRMADSIPADLAPGVLFINTSQEVTYPPVITLLPYNAEGLYNYYSQVGTGLTVDVPVRLAKYLGATNDITLQIVTANGVVVPQANISTTGNNAERLIHISNANLTDGSATLTIYATDNDGNTTSLPFIFHVVNEVRVITATTAYHPNNGVTYNGAISPAGTVTVPNGGDVYFTGVGDPGYALDSMSIDGGAWVDSDGYTFTNVVAAHTIAARFNETRNFKIFQSVGNGSISPTGDAQGLLPCVLGRSRTFTLTPADGRKITGYWIGTTNTPVVDNLGAPVEISAQIGAGETNIAGTWDSLDWDVIIGTHPNSTIAPSASTVGNDLGITVTFTPSQYYELTTASANMGPTPITLTGVAGWDIAGCTVAILGITDDITINCDTRIQAPLEIGSFAVTDLGTGNDLSFSWTADPRASSYVVKYSATLTDSAATIKASGTTLTQGSPTSTGCTGELVENTPYKFVVYGVNVTGTSPVNTRVDGTPTANVAPTVGTLTWVKVALH